MKIVLVVLDATRSDFLGPFGGRDGVTPTIDTLADSGLTFTNCYSGAPWTPASHATMFTGQYPSHHDVRGPNLVYPTDGHYFPERLSACGIRTQAIGAEPWLSRTQGVSRGFTRFHDQSKTFENLREEGHHTFGDLPMLFRAGAKYGIEKFRAQFGTDYGAGQFALFLFQEWTRRADAFTFLNISVAHSPYDPPAVFQRRIGVDARSDDPFVDDQPVHAYIGGEAEPDADVWAEIRDRYRGGIAHADYLLGRALETVDDDTWIIVTADHGDNLGENQRMGHQFSLHDNLINVPLVISHPSLDGHVRDDLVSHVDLAPTIYEIARQSGYDVSLPSGFPGRSLFDPVDDERVVFAEYGPPGPHINALLNNTENIDSADIDRLYQVIRAAMTDEFKLLWYSDGRKELYRRGEEDGPELSESHPEIVDDLLAAMDSTLAPPQEADMSHIDTYVRDDVKDTLEALGYL